MRRIGKRDRGQVAIEYIGFVPILLFVGLAGIQLGYVAYAYEQAGTAARAAARTEARLGHGGDAAGHAAVSDFMSGRLTLSPSGGGGSDAVGFTATITIPVILPLFSPDPATRSATMPNDDPEVSGP
ncbi:TadE/TadG family type IV pilus assembly protein [Streptomyces sp. NPDC089919]|uniref:TadE/TadG family type IV pilus assembly protein n=1 Tax=Streptomyces sp. NPDC089919 TaxID=3155188 RepID=UPI00343FBF5F